MSVLRQRILGSVHGSVDDASKHRTAPQLLSYIGRCQRPSGERKIARGSRYAYYGRPIGEAIIFCSCGLFFFMAALWNSAGQYILALWFLLFFFMAALRSRCGHYIFVLFFFFFLLLHSPRLISAIAEWMSTILPHMVWPLCEFIIL